MGRRQILADLHEFGLDPKKAHKLDHNRLRKLPMQVIVSDGVSAHVTNVVLSKTDLPAVVDVIDEIPVILEHVFVNELITENAVENVDDIQQATEEHVITEIAKIEEINDITTVADDIVKKATKKKKKDSIE